MGRRGPKPNLAAVERRRTPYAKKRRATYVNELRDRGWDTIVALLGEFPDADQDVISNAFDACRQRLPHEASSTEAD